MGFCGFTPDKNLEDKRLTMERSQATNFSAYFKKYLYKIYPTCAIKNFMRFFNKLPLSAQMSRNFNNGIEIYQFITQLTP